MKLPRRKFLHLAAGAAALPSVSRMAWAQTYPTRPVRFVVGFPAGSAVDVLAHPIGQWLAERLGQQFVIENRAGAAGNVAAGEVVRASPDGYTILMVGPANAINAALYDKLDFNFIRDIAPVASLVRIPCVMVVHPSFPVKTVPEFIAYAKANPGKIKMGSAGNGSATHVFGELFKVMAGVDLRHSGNLAAVVAGEADVMFELIPSSIDFIRGNKLRALAAMTATRMELLPELPTVGEFVPGYEASSFAGIGAPRNTPTNIIDRLNKEINAGLADPKLKARLANLGGTVLAGSPAEFGKLIADETAKWGKVIRDANIKLN
jgi:tripartite-type tricarboxylate transporter receptor subunit TctC